MRKGMEYFKGLWLWTKIFLLDVACDLLSKAEEFGEKYNPRNKKP